MPSKSQTASPGDGTSARWCTGLRWKGPEKAGKRTPPTRNDAAMPLIRDLAPLLILHLTVLVATIALGSGNLADVRVQATWTLFLAIGWLMAPHWTGDHGSLARRYLAAMISAVAVHGLLVAAGSWIGIGMNVYLMIWGAGLLIAGISRARKLRQTTRAGWRIPLRHAAVTAAVILFVVCVFRTPRSNDIHQFLLQQQDMLANHSLQVSSIGMSAMDVNQPMPRWNAHYWHLLPSLIAHTSGIAVDQVLLRYATIPVAFSVLICLIEMVRSLAGRRVTYPFVLAALTGPVLLWFRNFNAFNYSFRITNNLLLDKDFALFFLIPATAWLAGGWIKGKHRYAIPLIGLIPALVRFHPLTAVYLLLIFVPVAILSMNFDRASVCRAGTLLIAACVLFAVVVLLGDAQSNHEQIRQIIQMDYAQSLAGRPLHYWVGFYNVIPDTSLPSDTTQWVGDQFRSKHTLITGCGLLAMMHLGLLALIARCWSSKRPVAEKRVLVSGLITAAMLWGMWLVSGAFLTRFPHYAAGYERLHWFAYPIALAVVSAAATSWMPRYGRRPVGVAILAFVVISAAFGLAETNTALMKVRGLNSLLDYEIYAMTERRIESQQVDPNRTLTDLHPEYLGPNDRVLLLDPETTKHYWLIRQGVFWSDPYVEAFAWFHRGDDFLNDREFFYDVLDRQLAPNLAGWLTEKRITLIVDDRDGGDEAIAKLAKEHNLSMKRIEPGVWRIQQ